MAQSQTLPSRGFVWGALTWTALLGLFPASLAIAQEPQELNDFREKVVHYRSCENLADPVSRLNEQLVSGKSKLRFEPRRGYLASLLQALHISVSSQALVFSKTSSQDEQTSPRTPRAIYCSQDVYVGWVPDCPQIDLAAMDPQRGTIFYTLEQRADAPKFVRRFDCLRCHETGRTLQVPGLFVRSTYTGKDGSPLATLHEFVSGHNSPITERWAGWYVSGTHVAAAALMAGRAPRPGEGDYHLGNLISTNTFSPDLVNIFAGANCTDLRPLFDAPRYLSRHSDIVALLVLEHQVRMLNLITVANYETRSSLAEIKDNPGELVDWNNLREDGPWPQRRIAQAGERLLAYMLMRDEAPLNGPVKGTTSFTAEFQRIGPRAGGRSLRDLDLRARLFRYPCSFLVYSSSFDGLPAETKNYLWRRLAQILSGRDRSETYRTMPERDRVAVLDILRQTKPEFAAWLNCNP